MSGRFPILTYHGVNIAGNDYASNDHVALRSDLAELFQLRECLEGFAAGLAASQVTVASHRAWLAEARRVWLS